MRDVALASGVDRSTVSRVFNAAPSRVPIAADTRARVMEAADRLGFRPNPLARGLAGSRTMLIGAVMRDFSDPFFADAIEALAQEAVNHEYNIVVGGQGRWREGLPLKTVLEVRYCDAVIMVGDLEDQPRLLADLRASKVPVVALWQGVSPLEFPSVDVDNRAGTMLGLEHLIGLGHERIAFVSARLPGDNLLREQAYLEFMHDRFGGIQDGYVQRVPNTLAGGETALRALLSLPQPPTAVATSTDLTAVGVLHAAYAFGGIVPSRLSVVGWDDLTVSAYTAPGLTTLKMPTREIVAEGVRIAVALARDSSARHDPSIIQFTPTLVVRESTAPPGELATLIATGRASDGTRLGVGVTGISSVSGVPAVGSSGAMFGLGAALGPGEVAFAIPVDPSQAVGGAVAPGAHVTVVAVPKPHADQDDAASVNTGIASAKPGDVPEGGSDAMPPNVWPNLRVLALRTVSGLPFTGEQKTFEPVGAPERLGSVVVAIPADKLAKLAAAIPTSTCFLALSDPTVVVAP
jgi:DNA-binding LacI/PurR family transcriptional regulator